MGLQEHQLAQLLLVWVRVNPLLPCVLWSLLQFSVSLLGPVAFVQSSDKRYRCESVWCRCCWTVMQHGTGSSAAAIPLRLCLDLTQSSELLCFQPCKGPQVRRLRFLP